ncbi:MAG: hypothetical protein ABH891_07425 [Candidatus Omnitrophota bacterium]
MTALDIFGIYIIVSSLAFNFWCAAHGKQNAKNIGHACWVAVTAGFLLIVADRITEIPTPWGSFKSLAKQAVTDIHAITKIRKEVEAQKKTIDIVTKETERAERLSQDAINKTKIADGQIITLDNQIQESRKLLAQMKQSVEFIATFSAAQNDDARAYEQLSGWADKDTPFKTIADNAIVKIRLDAGGPMEPGFLNINWSIDPKTLSFQQIMDLATNLQPIFHAALVNEMKNRSDFSKKEKMRFYVEMLSSSNSLSAKNYAGKFFTSEAGDNNLKWQPFSTVELFDWWNKNKDKV